jgi:hypothetical protein
MNSMSAYAHGQERGFAALPPEVRKGFAFPIAYLFRFLRGYASRWRRSLHSFIRNSSESPRLSAHQAAEPLIPSSQAEHFAPKGAGRYFSFRWL